MKKILCMIALAAMVTGSNVYAQGGRGGMAPQHQGMKNGAEMIQANVKKLTEELQLTNDQAAKIEALYKQQFEARKALREQAMQSGQRPDMNAMKAERAELDKKIAGILTPEQNARYAELQKKRENGLAGQKGHGPQMPDKAKKGKKAPGEGMMEKMQKELNLTDSQAAQVKEVFAKQSMQRSADRRKTMEANQSQMEQRKAEADKALAAILTPEQYAKYKEMQHKQVSGQKK